MTPQRMIEVFLGSPLTEEESQHMDELARQADEQHMAELERWERKHERAIRTTETWGDLERYEAMD